MITKEQMKAYENIRQSGVTNMFDVKTVIQLSDGILTKDDCMDIMQNYIKYMEEFEIERDWAKKDFCFHALHDAKTLKR